MCSSGWHQLNLLNDEANAQYANLDKRSVSAEELLQAGMRNYPQQLEILVRIYISKGGQVTQIF